MYRELPGGTDKTSPRQLRQIGSDLSGIIVFVDSALSPSGHTPHWRPSSPVTAGCPEPSELMVSPGRAGARNIGRMHERDDAEVQRRLNMLAPLLRRLGEEILGEYERAGLLSAFGDIEFPVADARFIRHGDRLAYHPRGAVYFHINRAGELALAGQEPGASLTDALVPYVRLGHLHDVQGSGSGEAPTEPFPPPRLLLDIESSELLIADVSGGAPSGTAFVPLEQYLTKRARLFTAAFHASD